MGSKRGRLLTRQPRVKKDTELSMAITTTSSDAFNAEQCWLTVPTTSTAHHIIERHVSDPTPQSVASSSGVVAGQQLLHVPQAAYLTKQYSHPLLPSQSQAINEQHQYKLLRQLSQPNQSVASASTGVTTFVTAASTIAQLVSSSMKTEPGDGMVVAGQHHQQQVHHQPNPTVVIVPDNTVPELPTIRVKSEELQRSISTPQVNMFDLNSRFPGLNVLSPTQSLSREPSLDSPRSSHCPVVRPGPALGCNFCWNTIDAHGRILRRKTKYHCPECQTNLCIVPCFQEYHERQTSDNPQPVNENKVTSLKHYSKSGSM
jgi:hypothetical protein